MAELSEGAQPWQLLVRIEAAGIDPDGHNVLEGWEATPHQRFERLLREKGVFTGVLISERAKVHDGETSYHPELRLIYAPRGETSGYLVFPLRPLRGVAGRPMLGGLKLLLDNFRLHGDAPDRRLTALLKRSRDAQAAVSNELAGQVLGALHELLRGLDDAERSLIRDLAQNHPGELYDGLLAVLMRLVFILYAEDRGLLPNRADARTIYETSYSVRGLYSRLLEDAALNPDTMDERVGGWGRLIALFRLIHKGHPSGFIQARGGKLFDPDEHPFLEGRATAAESGRILQVSDGCLLRVLEGLMTLKARGGGRERLSYRTLDVEQIGSVCETVMGFKAMLAEGASLAIKGGKNNRTPVFLNLDQLCALSGVARTKAIAEAGRTLSTAQAKPVQAARTVEELSSALASIVDDRGSPRQQPTSAGTPILQPTDERRRTGSHYTPRSLTAPIVLHALEPAFERLGPHATAEQVLDLKVCDPAMGSGAFLVEACRVLGERVVKAWERWPNSRPPIPAGEDEDLLAKRLVAQRCLYGVDKNPRAVDLAKLSLWLATLAGEHEFTFLDHALKCGDSLVGLDLTQIEATHWDRRQAPTLIGHLVGEHLRIAEEGRARIRATAEFATEAELQPQLKAVNARISVARIIGDGVIGAFFAADKAKLRIARVVAFQQAVQSHLGNSDWIEAVHPFYDDLYSGENPIQPFHWQVEFLEVFRRNNPGFDAIVGNPPFAGKNTIIAGNRPMYLPWLQTVHEGAHGNADLVAHFFRRAFGLLRQGGVFGLIATNTIGQGYTRATGLTNILGHGGHIIRAARRHKWLGEAAVVVSIIHVAKGADRAPVLDEKPVRRISAYLVEGDLDTSPESLAANARKAFQGSIVLGMGFTFDDAAAAKGAASSLADIHALIEKNPRNAERIFPYIGGEEISTDPRHAHHRYVIDFADFPLRRDPALKSWFLNEGSEACEKRRREWVRDGVVPRDYPDPVAEDWPDLIEIVRRRVKPERDNDGRKARRERWCRFGDRQPGLYCAITGLDRILITGAAAVMHHMISSIGTRMVFSHKTIVFVFDGRSGLAALQSRPHEIWSRQFGTTFGSVDALTYNPTQVFRTFPFPIAYEVVPAVECAGEAYDAHRAALMIARNEGLTKTYNRFHARAETAPDIVRLRELHADMDRAVLSTYGWNDLAERAAPEFIEQDADEGKTPKTRLDWPAEFKDEVLARLLALNAERAAAEKRAGMVAALDEGEDDDDGE